MDLHCVELFGWSIDGMLRDPVLAGLDRDLNVVELWAGKKAVADGAGRRGFAVATAELHDDPIGQDLTTPLGFQFAVGLVMRLARNGLLVMAPTCSSFVFSNMSRTKRGQHNYVGDETYPPVRWGNIQAQVAAFLLALAVERSIFTLLENPRSSMIFNYPPVKLVLETVAKTGFLHTCIAHHCRFSSKPRGQRSFKPFKLVTVGPTNWASKLAKHCNCKGAGHVMLMETGPDGQKTGSKRLTASQIYSIAFGKAIVQAWAGCHKPTASWNEGRIETSEDSSGGPAERAKLVPLSCDWRDRHAPPQRTKTDKDLSEQHAKQPAKRAKLVKPVNTTCDWRERHSPCTGLSSMPGGSGSSSSVGCWKSRA
jgi:hypothetical protein